MVVRAVGDARQEGADFDVRFRFARLPDSIARTTASRRTHNIVVSIVGVHSAARAAHVRAALAAVTSHAALAFFHESRLFHCELWEAGGAKTINKTYKKGCT